ncbi:chromosome segregation protein SMC [Anaerohalosphaera lusitana]|uniref:Chromosome segregation protein SMC n=1 Tax=Anaerohalosphaera lusitana TaxID=1936003 RepID=A0A1U9NQ97_9BACT|nr:hypothetical protein [Anaerohalosphaera lusitana]AQT70112.1 chromosome segregation protein SMC [Anaerohalosphaera lusitana]
MSTLTKVLIVLLSFGVIFLCATTVSYVSSTSTAQSDLEDLRTEYKALEGDRLAAETELNQVQAQAKKLEEELQAEITELRKENNMLAVDKRTAETASMEYQSKYTNLASSLESLENTIGNLQTLLASTQDQLEDTRAQSIRDRKYLNETTEELMAKTVRLESLQARLKQVLEQKQTLEEQLAGEEVTVATVTPTPGEIAKPAGQVTTTQPIRGLVTEVRENLVGISVGAADGVKEGQTFHVIRGEEFICNIEVTNVDTSKAAGVLELVEQRPRVGDNVTTEL